MQYYNRSTNQTVQSLPDYATEKNCRDYGWWPIYDAPFTEDLRYWTRVPGAVEFNEDSQSCTQHWVAVPLPLESIKASKAEDFAVAFKAIEDKSARGLRPTLLALYDRIEAMEQPVTDDPATRAPLTPLPVEDIGIVWELEQIAVENRLMRDCIMGTTIPENATEEEARAILVRLIDTKPWLPWEA